MYCPSNLMADIPAPIEIHRDSLEDFVKSRAVFILDDIVEQNQV